MFNQVILVGNLTRDVEIRYSQSGSAIGNVGIATSRKWKTQTGEQKEEVMFIDLIMFGRTSEIANQYCRKGSKVLVSGRISFQQWTDQQGGKRSKHVITVENLQMLDSKADSQNSSEQQSQYAQPSQGGGYGGQNAPSTYGQPQAQASHNAPQQQTPSVPEIDIDDDEIPF